MYKMIIVMQEISLPYMGSASNSYSMIAKVLGIQYLAKKF